MNVRSEFQKWTSSRIREISLCGVTSILVLGSDCLPVQAAGWLSLPAIRKPKEKEAAPEKAAPDHSEAIFRAMNEAKAEEKKGHIDRAMMFAERAMRLAESNVSEDEPGSKVLVTATTTYFNELKSRKSEAQTKKTSKSDEKKVATKPKAGESKATAKSPTDEQPKTAKQQKPKPAPRTLRSEKIDEHETISKAMKSEMEPSETRPTDPKPESGKSSALAEALETPKQQLKPTRRYQKASTLPVTPVLSKVAEKPNNFVDEKPIAKIEEPAVVNTVAQSPLTEPEVEPEFDPFPDDRPKSLPSKKVVTHKQFAELWDAQSDTEEKAKSAEPAWTAENERPNGEDLFGWAEKQNEVLSRADEPEDDQELVDARRSMRIKLRPRHANQEIQTPASVADIANDARPSEPAPQIHPMLRSPEGSRNDLVGRGTEVVDTVKIQSFDDEQHERQTAIAAKEIDSIDSSELDDWNDDDSSNNNFPTKKVLELKRRLESCVALQPGEIAVPPISNPLTELFATDEDEVAAEEVIAESNEIRPKRADSDWWEDAATSDASEVAQANTPNAENTEEAPRELNHKRVIKAEVTARMSLIRWRAATDAPPAEDEVAKAHTDIRESLAAAIQGGKESLLSLPSMNVSLNESPKSSDQSTIQAPSGKRPLLKGSAWDHAPAPNDELSAVAARSRRSNADRSLNSDMAPPAPVEQISFDGRHQHGRNGTNAGELVPASVIEIPELSMPSVANMSYSTSATNDASAGDSSFNSDPTFDQGESAVVLNGPVERFAFVCGISTPAAAACLGALAVALAVAGIFAVRSVIRVALAGQSEA